MIFDTDDLYDGNDRLDLLQQLKLANPAFKMTAFVIPGLCSPEYMAALPDWIECVNHGWLHTTSYEAQNWTRDEAIEVMLATAALSPRFVIGHKSPGWQISDGTYQACLGLDWWVADHPDNDQRRPQGLLTHVLGTGDHVHTHVQDVCGNGLEETYDELEARVREATTFRFVSEVVAPWFR